MKNKTIRNFLCLFIATAAFTLNSCKKEHVCTCVDSDDGYTEIFTIPKSSKKDAKAACSSLDYVGTSYTTTCTLN